MEDKSPGLNSENGPMNHQTSPVLIISKIPETVSPVIVQEPSALAWAAHVHSHPCRPTYKPLHTARARQTNHSRQLTPKMHMEILSS